MEAARRHGRREEAATADERRNAARALAIAQRFLGRWDDVLTRRLADDVAQNTAIEVWLWRDRMLRPDRLAAFVRTVCRRLRSRALVRHLSRPTTSLDADEDVFEQLVDEAAVRRVRVGRRLLSLPWCLDELDGALAGLGSLNRRLLLAYYEGFSCSELAERYGLPLEAVKARLHRNRKRVRHELEGRLRTDEDGDAGPDQPRAPIQDPEPNDPE